MLKCLVFLLAMTGVAGAQVAQQPGNGVLNQIVPESVSVSGSALATQINWYWRTAISYSVTNKTGMNLYMGVAQGGVSLGSCGEFQQVQGGLPMLPSPAARVYSAPAGSGPPMPIFVPASGHIVGILILNNCAAPNPGSPTAPLSMTLLLSEGNDWKQMATLPVSAEIPIRQITGQ